MKIYELKLDFKFNYIYKLFVKQFLIESIGILQSRFAINLKNYVISISYIVFQ